MRHSGIFRSSILPYQIRNVRELRTFNPKLRTSPEAKSMTGWHHHCHDTWYSLSDCKRHLKVMVTYICHISCRHRKGNERKSRPWHWWTYIYALGMVLLQLLRPNGPGAHFINGFPSWIKFHFICNCNCRHNISTGPLITKRTDVLPQYFLKSRSPEIMNVSLWNLTSNSAALLDWLFLTLSRFLTVSWTRMGRAFSVQNSHWVDSKIGWALVSHASHQAWICSRYMMTSSNGNIFRVTDPLWGESTSHRWILLTKDKGAWENNWDTGDLRRHRAHYVVTVMIHICRYATLYIAGLLARKLVVEQLPYILPTFHWCHISVMSSQFIGNSIVCFKACPCLSKQSWNLALLASCEIQQWPVDHLIMGNNAKRAFMTSSHRVLYRRVPLKWVKYNMVLHA